MIIQSRKIPDYIPPDGHIKYKNKDDKYVPSVTTVIGVMPKESLIYWANSLGWKRKSVSKELEYAANVGTTVHEYIEKIITNDKVNNDYNEAKIEYDIKFNYITETKNALLSFLDWYKINRNDLELIEIEKSMSGNTYGGTCDMICKYKDQLMIFDFKTSSDFYFSMFVQLAAYVRLYENYSDDIVKDVAVLRMDKKNGEIAKFKRLSDIPNGDIDYYYYVFEQCLNMWNVLRVLESDWKLK